MAKWLKSSLAWVGDTRPLAFGAFVVVVGGGAVLSYWFEASVSAYAVTLLSLSVGFLLIFRHIGGAKFFIYNAAFLLVVLSLGELYFQFNETSDGTAYHHMRHGGPLGYSAKPGV